MDELAIVGNPFAEQGIDKKFCQPEIYSEPIQEEWNHDQWLGLVKRLSMMRIEANEGGDSLAEQETERVDEDVALAAGDFLARVKPLWVERCWP